MRHKSKFPPDFSCSQDVRSFLFGCNQKPAVAPTTLISENVLRYKLSVVEFRAMENMARALYEVALEQAELRSVTREMAE
jgi:hypothetical protein